MSDLFSQAQELFEYSRFLRRDFHRNPELGFKEVRTAGVIARELSQLGLEVHTGVAETGVVALIEGDHPGPTTLIRFDMDALPINEETGVEFASIKPGLMHACGHDGHVAVGLTVARMLVDRREPLHGTIKLVFQPAEEGLGGAERMVEQGIMDDPKVDFTLAMHLWNQRPVGWAAINPGPLMAGADLFSVRIHGRGGHGALPQEAVDPIAAGAQIISALQTIVSRNTAPADTAVVSVCSFHAGDAPNVIPMWADLSGTFRTFDAQVRQLVVERFEAVVNGVAAAMGCTASINIQLLTPAVINDPEISALVEFAALRAIPDLQIDNSYRTMVSEDMSFLMQKAPGCYLMIGSANDDKGLNYGHHHPKFDFDEQVLPHAAAVMTASAFDLSKKQAQA
jgi:amidohydrolase